MALRIVLLSLNRGSTNCYEEWEEWKELKTWLGLESDWYIGHSGNCKQGAHLQHFCHRRCTSGRDSTARKINTLYVGQSLNGAANQPTALIPNWAAVQWDILKRTATLDALQTTQVLMKPQKGVNRNIPIAGISSGSWEASSTPLSKEPDEHSPQFHGPCWHYPSIYCLVSQVFSSFQVFQLNTVCISHLAHACMLHAPSISPSFSWSS